MKWPDSLEKRLDSFEKWLDSKLAGSMELEADLSRRRLLTGLAISLSNCGVIIFGGMALKWFTPAPIGVVMAAVIGFATACGIAAFLIHPYIKRRRAASRAP